MQKKKNKKQINKINSLSKEEEEEKNQNKSCNEGVLHDHGLFFSFRCITERLKLDPCVSLVAHNTTPGIVLNSRDIRYL